MVIDGLTIADGGGTNVGGAILVTGAGSLTLLNSTVSGSTATGGSGYGGGLYVDTGITLAIANSTLLANVAAMAAEEFIAFWDYDRKRLNLFR